MIQHEVGNKNDLCTLHDFFTLYRKESTYCSLSSLPDCRSKPDSEKMVQFSHVREQSTCSLSTLQCTFILRFLSTCIGCGHTNRNSDLSNGGGCE